MVVIDIDMNHRTKDGQEKPSGLIPFKTLLQDLDITADLFSDTLVVKTGSGGFHLYFTLPESVEYTALSQKAIAESVDVRTHAGYVIAAGTNGYSVQNDAPPAPLPHPLLGLITKKANETAKPYNPDRQLPAETLQKVLEKIDVTDFSTNDSWQEFITSAIAASGNEDDVITALEEWSRKDDNYKDDPTVRKRIETFEPSGGITAGTFIHILRQQQISKYLIDKVRMYIGAEFSFSEKFVEQYNPPFHVDYAAIHEYDSLMQAFYYAKNQTAAVTLFTRLTHNNLLYVEDERRFYYYNGNRWMEATGVLNVLFTVLLHAGMRYFTDKSKKEDSDAIDYFNAYVSYIGAIATLQRLESALRQHPDIARKSVPWDAPELESTLTLDDCVMDFSTKGTITFRKGKREEYRRLYIDLKEKDFEDTELPHNFRQFLKDVFPDEETRKTATYALSTMISGTGKFRKFQIWNGSGSNGKSALMDIMTKVIGKDRAVPYGAEILLSNRPNTSLTPELAALRGALVAFTSETEESKRVSQGMVKHLTGDEEMTANPKYQGMITFKTTFQLVLSTNYLPAFSAHDNAFVDRLLILPFYTCFYDSEEKKIAGERGGSRYFAPAKDISQVKQEIMKERAQILYYLAKRYQELGITIPESPECQQAKNHYVQDNNSIQELVHEVIEFDEVGDKDWFTPTKDIVDYYNEDQNTKYSSKFILMRIKEVLPLVESTTKRVNGKLTRGLRHIRLKHGVYPEGYTGNFTPDELRDLEFVEAQF
jgi:phage/plasmid-associated DNA primase